MQLISSTLRISSYSLICLGVLIGSFGYVRTGSLLIGGGTLGHAIAARNSRRIEFFLPAAIAVALFVLAIALPHGR
jgi:hypothetical protein